MRKLSSTLWTGTAVALALAAAPAAAQTAQSPATDPAAVPATDPAAVPVDEQAAPVDAAEAADPAAGDDAIVVTGIRKSLESAKNLKRRSNQIVDAIVAEDIGKLPDIAVSETAARIPGVQVTRRAGEADSVLVRGLPDFSTTYNGREIFTAQTRVVALQDFPSANIAAIEVYKSSTADLVEAGLAGLVNVRSRKPFDFKGFEFAGSAWGIYSKQAGKWNPNLNLLVTNRWDVGSGEFGALLNVSYTELDYLDSEVSNTDFIAGGPAGSRFPDIQRIFYNSGNRIRPSVNAALQYRPTPDIEIYAEGLWQGFRNKISSRGWNQPLWGGSQYTNLEFRDGTDLLSSGSVTNPFRADGFQGGTYNKTDTYQFALGGSWDAGPLRLSADLARSMSKFTGSTSSVDYRVVRGYTVNFDNETPEFSFEGFDPGNPANYLFQGYYEEEQVSKGDDWQFRLDADYDTGIEFLPKIEAGFRFSDRDAHREFGNRFAQFDNQNIPISSVPLNYELFRSGFRGTDVQSGFTNWLAPSYNDIRNSRVDLRSFVIGLPPGNFGFINDVCCTGNYYSLNDVEANPAQVYDAREKSTAAYAQVHYKIGEVVDGVIGIRAVRTKTAVSGSSRVETSPGVFAFLPVDGSNSYTDWLPNASARIKITPELQLRLAATQTRTRPTFEQLNPSFSLGPPRVGCNPNGDPFGCARSGGGGNPGLTPFLSNNYDASLEYFFSRSGFIAAAVFRRDLKGFIQNDEDRVQDPVLGPIIINKPFNTSKARISGAELQLSTFLDFEFLPAWARKFGTQANVTYLKTEVADPDSVISDRRIYGVSKWTYNLASFYENGPFAARLSYNKRSKTLETVQNRGNGSDLYIETGSPAGRLDFSTSYNVRDNFTLFFDWTNILNKPYRQDFSSARDGAARADYIRFLRYEETIFSGGLRFRFN